MLVDKVIHWFRQDLRLSDNPAFCHATQESLVLPIYILDDENAAEYAMGAASRVWLYHSLTALDQSLNGHLSLYKGDPLTIIKELCTTYSIQTVVWNRCYEPWRMKRDAAIKAALQKHGIKAKSFNASLLWEPWTVKKEDDTPYKVFTPFYRKGCLNAEPPRNPLPKPKKIHSFKDESVALDLAKLGLLPTVAWDKSIRAHWKIGEHWAQQQLQQFLKTGLPGYKKNRNFPAKPYVSRLSPHLHFGEVSPHQIWHTARNLPYTDDIDHFCSELGWREFSYNLLYYNPDLPKTNLQKKFDHFPWQENLATLQLWQKGLTGIPIVDAGMRELWQTGYMHNRVRMIVGSFLVKNLRTDWRYGERWFWDCLVDADLANNSASWQWVAGCGADAAPYFRVFNPVVQGQKFDPEGEYVKRYVPELKNLSIAYLFNPWDTPESVLENAGIVLGRDYPKPIVDLKLSREDALLAFQRLDQNVPSTKQQHDE